VVIHRKYFMLATAKKLRRLRESSPAFRADESGAEAAALQTLSRFPLASKIRASVWTACA
jgi:hypothetical protein